MGCCLFLSEERSFGHVIQEPIDPAITIPVLLGLRPDSRVVYSTELRYELEGLFEHDHTVIYVNPLSLGQLTTVYLRYLLLLWLGQL